MMNDLDQLDRRIEEKLAAARERNQRCQESVRRRMEERERRQSRFAEIADRVVASMIRPRLERLAARFDNATLVAREQATRYRCLCRFDHVRRFPATVRLEVGVTHDASAEQFLGIYHLEILPKFFPFKEHDQLAFPLEAVDERKMASWLDERVIEFLDTYLRLEEVEAYQRENLVTDPVCGMLITTTCAVGERVHEGEKFHFCCETCRHKFDEDPRRYVTVKHLGEQP